MSDEGFEYVRIEDKSDLYRPNGNNGNMQTGARVLDDGRFEFRKNNAVLGRSDNRFLYDNNGQRGDDNRWRATSLVQPAEPYSEESIGRIRDADDTRDASIASVVVDGYVVQGTMQVRNPNNTNQRRNVDFVKVFVAGEKMYQGPEKDYFGNNLSDVRIGDLIYRRTGSDTKMVGQAGNRISLLQVAGFAGKRKAI